MSSVNRFGAQQEIRDFDELWVLFQKKPFPLSLDQSVILIDGLHHQKLLTEPVADDILRYTTIDQQFLDDFKNQAKADTPPNYRKEIWRASDTTTLAAVGWAPGAMTHIHDHSHFGLTRTLVGSVTSFGFKWLENDTLEYLGKIHFETNRVYHVPTGRVFIHAVGNLSQDIAFELHFYGPSIEANKSNRYDLVEPVAIDKLQDGEQVKVKASIDPEQIELRFN